MLRLRTAVVVDPFPHWVDVVERALRSSGIDVVGSAGSLDEATVLIEQTQPDLAVVEFTATKRDPATWLREHRQCWPETNVIVFSNEDDPESITAALAEGAVAWVIKRAQSDEVAAMRNRTQARSLARQPHQPGLLVQLHRHSAAND